MGLEDLESLPLVSETGINVCAVYINGSALSTILKVCSGGGRSVWIFLPVCSQLQDMISIRENTRVIYEGSLA